MNLYLDLVSTTGIWLWNRPEQDSGQPHMIRFAALLGNDDLCVRLITPLPGWPPVPSSATLLHGIDRDDFAHDGTVLGASVARVNMMIARAARIISHNAAFHMALLRRAFRDVGIPVPQMPEVVCTMRESADLVRTRLISQGRWSWPSLYAAYERFAGTGLYLPSDPIQRGEAMVRAVALVHQGIEAVRTPPLDAA